MGRKKSDNASLTIRIPKSYVNRIEKIGKTPSDIIGYALTKYFEKDGSQMVDSIEETFIDINNQVLETENKIRELSSEIQALNLQLQTIAMKAVIRTKRGEKIIAPSIMDYLRKNPDLIKLAGGD